MKGLEDVMRHLLFGLIRASSRTLLQVRPCLYAHEGMRRADAGHAARTSEASTMQLSSMGRIVAPAPACQHPLDLDGAVALEAGEDEEASFCAASP